MISLPPFRQMLQRLQHLPSLGYLWLGALIFGASNPVTKRIIEIGDRNFIEGENPVSFCNVFFAGNICALLSLSLIYRNKLKLSSFRTLSSRDWLGIFSVAILSGVLAPAIYYEALARTAAVKVILLGRLDTPLVLLLSVIFLKARLNFWQFLGAAVSFGGIVLIFGLQSVMPGSEITDSFMEVDFGEGLTILGAVVLAIATTISKANLSRIAPGVFVTVRTLLATIIFFFLALTLYGSDHFVNLAAPFLWGWMLIYGGVIVALGQSSWLTGLKQASASQLAIASSAIPIFGVIGALIILGEEPGIAEWIGGAVVFTGIIFNQIGERIAPRKRSLMEVDSETGFKGV